MALAATLFLGACGSGGGGGGGGGGGVNTSRATIDDTNKNDAAEGARVGSRKAIESGSAPLSATSSGYKWAVELARRSHDAARLGQSPVGVEEDFSEFVCPGGGQAFGDFPASPGASGTATFDYIQCVITQPGVTPAVTVHGTAVYSWTNNFENFTYTYDITVTDGTNTYELNGTVTCTNSGQACTHTEDFSANGVDYRVSDVSVSGNNSVGYNVTATVYIGDMGWVTITAPGLILCPGGGAFMSGNVQVTDSTGAVVLDVTFTDCDSMMVTFGGVTEPVPQ